MAPPDLQEGQPVGDVGLLDEDPSAGLAGEGVRHPGRTTMVALLDALEAKGLVTRHPHAEDRRKNTVELTAPGRDTLRHATQASDDAERRFLAPLTEPAAQQLKDALRTLLTPRSQLATNCVSNVCAHLPTPDAAE